METLSSPAVHLGDYHGMTDDLSLQHSVDLFFDMMAKSGSELPEIYDELGKVFPINPDAGLIILLEMPLVTRLYPNDGQIEAYLVKFEEVMEIFRTQGKSEALEVVENIQNKYASILGILKTEGSA